MSWFASSNRADISGMALAALIMRARVHAKAVNVVKHAAAFVCCVRSAILTCVFCAVSHHVETSSTWGRGPDAGHVPCIPSIPRPLRTALWNLAIDACDKWVHVGFISYIGSKSAI